MTAKFRGGIRPLYWGLAITVLSFGLYWLTAFRTITWWENAEFSAAAVNLGVVHAPGGLLPTILGWLFTFFVFAPAKAFALNLMAALAAVATVLMVFRVTDQLLRHDHSPIGWTRGDHRTAAVGVAIGALTLAFSRTLWQHATYYSPYVFNALFGIFIVAAMIGWWRAASTKSGARWLFVVMLLIGLDFSVHRTNALLIPGLFFWVLIRRPRTFISLSAWLYAPLGLMLGLAFHFLMIPMAAAAPAINANDPSNLARFWDYVSLKQYGGGWLINLLPRKAPFWQVQVTDYVTGFGLNFLPWNSPGKAAAIFPTLVGLFGLVGIWIRNRRFGWAMLLLFLTTSAGAVIYFNIEDNFFRTMYRHYLPSFVIFGVWIAYGAALLWTMLARLTSRVRAAGIVAVLLLLWLLPGNQVLANYRTLDASNNYFTYDYGRNFLATLPQNALVITYGDNDTFPAWYLQQVEHIRPDVTVINYALANTIWYIRQLRQRDLYLPLTDEAVQAAAFGPVPWHERIVPLPLPVDTGATGSGAGVIAPDSLMVTVPAALGGRYLLPAEYVLLQMVHTGRWSRPICFSAAGYVNIPGYWKPYLRLEGLTWQLIPAREVSVDRELLRRNLLEKYSYRGWNDPKVAIDGGSQTMAGIYLGAFMTLAGADGQAGDTAAFRQTVAAMKERLPIERLEPLPPQLGEAIRKLLSEE